MPELPEVETVRRGLEKSIKGKTFKKVILRRPNLRIPFPPDFSKSLEGKTITNITRRSKYLLMENDGNTVIIAHLGMSGKILTSNNIPANPQKHDHVIMHFTDGSSLTYNDSRRFGLMTLTHKEGLMEHPLLSHLGPEPLTEDFDADYLYNALKSRNTNIKTAIMDAKIVVGVGNIYACESLFRSGISPKKNSSNISKKKIDLLVMKIKEILLEAIESGGSTLRDYVQSDGELGYFQHSHFVYGKENQPCLKCGNTIKRIKQQGRSTFYCPSCQR